MLGAEDAGAEGGGGVIGENAHGGLIEDGASIEPFIHQMNRAAGDLDAMFKGLALRIEAREGG